MMMINIHLMLLISATLLKNASAEIFKVNLGGADKLAKRSFNQSHIEPVTGAHIFEGTLEVGSPAQEATVRFDTGSYTFAYNYKHSSYCEADGCTTYGAYDPSDSSTSKNTTSTYSANYMDGAGGGGHYFNDTLTIAGMSVDNYKFGLLETSNSEVNVMGMSLIAGDDNAPVLYNFLAHHQYISRKVFSTYYGSNSGAIVFGGLDEAKYTGTLERIAVVDPNFYNVILTGVSTDCGVVNTNGYEVLLDTGSDANIIAQELYHQLHHAIGGELTEIPIQGYADGPDGPIHSNYVLKCADAKPLYFDFSGKKVTYPPQHYLIALNNGNSPLVDSNGNALCTTNFFNGGDGSETGFILGANFLRSLYVVWDVDNVEVAIADGVFSSNEELVEITGEIPNANTAKYYASPNSATTDTSYASAATASLKVTTILTSNYYSGPFETVACLSTSLNSIASSSSTYSSSVSTIPSESFTSSGSSSVTVVSDITTIHSATTSTISSAFCADCIGEEVSTFHSSTFSTTAVASSSVASSSVVSGATTIYSVTTSTVSSAICAPCSGHGKEVSSVHSSSFSTTSVGTCILCVTSSTTLAPDSSESVSSSVISSFVASTTSGVSVSRSFTSSSGSSSSTTSEAPSQSVSSYFEHKNSTVIKTITSCSNNACAKLTTTNLLVPSSTASVESVSSYFQSVTSVKSLSTSISQSSSSKKTIVKPSTIEAKEPSESSAALTTHESSPVQPTGVVALVESSSIESSSIESSSIESSVSKTAPVESSPIPTAETTLTPESSLRHSYSPLTISSLAGTETAVDSLPTTSGQQASTTTPSSSLIQSISSDQDTTVTLQTYITLSQQPSASVSSQYDASSVSISTYEGAGNVGVEVPHLFKLLSTLMFFVE